MWAPIYHEIMERAIHVAFCKSRIGSISLKKKKNAGGWSRFVDSPKEVSKRLCQFGALPRSMPYIVYLKLETRGVATKFRLGGRIQTEGRRIQVIQNHLPPNSDLSSDFAHFSLEALKNLFFWYIFREISFKNRDFWGDIPRNSELGGDTYPPSPPPRWRRRPCLRR